MSGYVITGIAIACMLLLAACLLWENKRTYRAQITAQVVYDLAYAIALKTGDFATLKWEELDAAQRLMIITTTQLALTGSKLPPKCFGAHYSELPIVLQIVVNLLYEVHLCVQHIEGVKRER